MTLTAKTLIGYVPLLIFAGVMLWRLKTVQKARPLRLRTMWILPAILVLVVGFVFVSLPPNQLGIACFVLGIALGGGAGWQRARLMRLHVEGEGASARVMMRQSPAALLLVMGIAAARSILRAASGGSHIGGGHTPTAAIILTDALLGFAIGMVFTQRGFLWRRAKQVAADHVAGLGS